jgi:hypothetical protein
MKPLDAKAPVANIGEPIMPIRDWTVGVMSAGSTTAASTVIVIVTVADSEPSVEVAVNRNSVAGVIAVGIPLMVPVAVSRIKPVGRSGSTLKITVPGSAKFVVDSVISIIPAFSVRTVVVSDEVRVGVGAPSA